MTARAKHNLTLLLAALAVLVLSQRGGTAGTAIIPGDKLMVLVVEDTQNRNNLPYEQRLALASQKWRTAIKQSGGELKKIEPGQDIGPSQVWRAAAQLERGEAPWWIVSNAPKGRGVSQPFPKTADEALRTIQEVTQ